MLLVSIMRGQDVIVDISNPSVNAIHGDVNDVLFAGEGNHGYVRK